MWPNLQIADQKLYGIARGAAVVAGIFSFIICILMIANYLQSRALDPIDNAPLEALIQKLQENPQDETLREQVRALDLLSRKALFVSQWQLKTGAYLLLGGVIVLLAALKTMDSLREKLPAPEGLPDESESWLMSTKARQWTAGLGVFLLGTALIFAFFSYSELSDSSLDEIPLAPTRADFLENWPNFRGPDGSAILPTASPPASWNVETGEGIKWNTPVPKPGFSSPIVWQERVFLTGGDREGIFVYAFDTENGELLWQLQVNETNDENFAAFEPFEYTGYAAPTMATNGRYVFAIFANGQLVCFDFNGNAVWENGLGIPDNHYGHSSSLLVYENLLIVQFDQASEGRLLALDVLSGNTVWRVNREIISWSSPICVDTGSRMELIVSNCNFVDSFDPKTGAKFWSIKCLDGEHGPSPAFADGILVVANEYSQATAIRVTEAGGEVMWDYVDELPDASSPLATGEYVFMPTSYGIMVCLDAKTGETLWDHKFDSGFIASPLLLGKNIYALDMSGVVHIFEARSEFKNLGDFPIGEKASSTPAYANGKLFIRGEKSLICISGVQ